MIYINALELINTAIKNGILQEQDNKIAVYRAGTKQNKEGWYLTEKDSLAKELMKNEKGQNELINALNKKGICFTPTDYSWLSD